MSTTNSHSEPGPGAGAAAVRPIMLVRYRPGVVGQTARTVHVVLLPTTEQAGAVSALCGAALLRDDLETVIAGEGMPCTVCVVTHVVTGTVPTGTPPTSSPDSAGLAAGGIAYQQWGWPVTLHRDQVQLSLHHDVMALTIPIPLCTEVTKILTQRRCTPPVLAHPYAPDHHILRTH